MTRRKETEIGKIPNDWEVKTFGDICLISRGASPRPIHDFITTSGIPWVKIADATAQKTRYIEWTKEYILEKGRENTVIVKPGDLIVSNSATPGIPKFLKIDAAIHDGWLFLKPLKNINKEYLYYLFLQERSKLVGLADGTIFKNLKTDIVRTHKIAIPPLPEQQRIVSILSSLDDKIELNSKMNTTLEKIAQTLFNHWFVEFEFPNKEGIPFKSNGGKMVWCEELKKEVPEGWVVTKIGDILELVYGKALKDDARKSGNTPVYGSNGVIGVHDKPLVEGPGIIVGRKGNAGTIIWSQTKFFPIDTTFFVKPFHASMSMYYLFFTLKMQNLDSLGADSAVPGLNRNIAYMNFVLAPPNQLLGAFEEKIKSSFIIGYMNGQESKKLELIRDSLLPKLMTGEMRVKVQL